MVNEQYLYFACTCGPTISFIYEDLNHELSLKYSLTSLVLAATSFFPYH